MINGRFRRLYEVLLEDSRKAAQQPVKQKPSSGSAPAAASGNNGTPVYMLKQHWLDADGKPVYTRMLFDGDVYGSMKRDRSLVMSTRKVELSDKPVLANGGSAQTANDIFRRLKGLLDDMQQQIGMSWGALKDAERIREALKKVTGCGKIEDADRVLLDSVRGAISDIIRIFGENVSIDGKPGPAITFWGGREIRGSGIRFNVTKTVTDSKTGKGKVTGEEVGFREFFRETVLPQVIENQGDGEMKKTLEEIRKGGASQAFKAKGMKAIIQSIMDSSLDGGKSLKEWYARVLLQMFDQGSNSVYKFYCNRQRWNAKSIGDITVNGQKDADYSRRYVFDVGRNIIKHLGNLHFVTGAEVVKLDLNGGYQAADFNNRRVQVCRHREEAISEFRGQYQRLLKRREGRFRLPESATR